MQSLLRRELADLMAAARALRDAGHGAVISYSPKVFIPLTKACRDACGYCTFAQPPARDRPPFLTPDAVLSIARAGAARGCTEALFTLGDKPERRYRRVADWLDRHGYATTLDYLRDMAALVLRETGLLPHLNPGVMTAADYARLRPVAVSMGVMLETTAARLGDRGGPHEGAPDKVPGVRLDSLAAAGAAAVPMTTGLLIGIGETRAERLEALSAIAELQGRYGHIQEVIIQPFRAKPGTRMAGHGEPALEELVWTIAVARLTLGAAMNIQSPPNLAPADLPALIDAGINDWGGVSPVTPDHVNPEAPWPERDRLAAVTAAAGKTLVPRLPLYPGYAADAARWLDPNLHAAVLRAQDAQGWGRECAWHAGESPNPPQQYRAAAARHRAAAQPDGGLTEVLDGLAAGQAPGEAEIVTLFAARGPGLDAVTDLADRWRREQAGDAVTYVVNRNINYTNICTYRCSFCAFSKGRAAAALRDTPYDLPLAEIADRAAEAQARGATEVCLQGGIHPRYTGDHYLAVLEAVKRAAPGIHVHAFSPLEVTHGATSLGLSIDSFLSALKAAGLGSLPGTAAEILDDEVRAVICPDKLSTTEWLDVVETAHGVGLPTTATIMFGHVDRPVHWARHLLHLRDLQARSGGLTEFVPLAFVHAEAPIYLRGRARRGPTWRESLLMHAVARLVLGPSLRNIQTSWVKQGPGGAVACLQAGANDLGGVLMNESITRAAGAAHGQELTAREMARLVAGIGRPLTQRGTLYQRLEQPARVAAE